MKIAIAAAALTFAALTAQSAGAQTGDGPFCISSPTGGPLCSFQTMAECQFAIMPSSTQHCFNRSSEEGTVGSGSSAPSPTDAPSPTRTTPLVGGQR